MKNNKIDNNGFMKPRMEMNPRLRQKVTLLIMVSAAFLLPLIFLFIYFNASHKDAHAAATGDYRSRGTGAWNGTSTWQRYASGSWSNVTSNPSNGDGVITIQSGHIITLSSNVNVDQFVISAGGQLTINSGRTMTIINPTGTANDLEVSGILSNAGSISINSGAVAAFQSGSTYIHNQNGGTVPTATWNSASTVQITGMTSTYPSGMGQSFGHVIFNNAMTGDIEMSSNLNAAGSLTISSTGTKILMLSNSSSNRTISVTGDMTVSAGALTVTNSSGTGSVSVGGNLNVSGGTLTNVNSSAAGTLTVTGSFNLSGGTVDLKNGAGNGSLSITGNMNVTGGAFNERKTSTSGTATVTVSGNFSQTAGTIDMSAIGATGTLNVAGNFSQTGGTITESSTGSGSIVFNKSGTQTYTSGGTISNTINFTVNSGATLNTGTSTVSGGGSFTLSSGGGIMIGSAAGIASSAATGNIQVTGTRTYNSGASYTYNASAPQTTGDGLPSTVTNLTLNNSSGLTLQGALTVSGTLGLTSGKIIAGANLVNVTNTSTTAITGYSVSNYIVGELRRSTGSTGTYVFPIGTSDQYEVGSVVLSGATGPSSFLVSFSNSTPLSILQPLANLLVNGSSVTDMLDYGYWTVTPNVPVVLGSYSVILSERGQTNATTNSSFTVLSRLTSLLPWLTPGSHVSQGSSGGSVTATRSGLKLGYEFGIGIAQTPMSLTFKNATLISGTGGQVNATYKFPNVTTNVDAWIRITDIQGGAYLDGIDNFSGGNGYDAAWQPYVNGAGNSTSSIGWKIMFKKAGTSTDTSLVNVAITGIDIDGDGSNLREFVEATWPYSYSLDLVTTLTVTELDSTYRATGSLPVIPNIDTSHTEAMYQINYSSINSFSYRTGTISNKSSAEVRQHALMFTSALTSNSTTTTSLPVELLYFTPTAHNDYVNLAWATATEINNAYFTVERSSNGRDYEQILKKDGAGNSSMQRKYTAADPSPLPGINYYRLKQTDFDGKQTCYVAKVIKFGSKIAANLSVESIGPNPFTTNFNLNYTTATEGNVEILVMNNAGKLIRKENINAEKGLNNYSFSDEHLTPGVYIININSEGETVTRKLVKQ